ncbi:MAG: GNAT family N-acetyltransferase [Actinobacteria bacterium]|nr:GNAT family N-acetyltransferase [Actinomycetota bacterium]
MLTVTCVDTLDGFRDLRDRWNNLATDKGSIFQTWEWCWTWWLKYGKGRKLFIICANEGDRLVGLAPLFVSSYFGLPFKVASFLGTGCSDYGDFLLDPGQADVAVASTLSFLRAWRGWDVLDLQQLPPGSPLFKIETMSGEFAVKRLGQDECYSLDLPGSHLELLGSLSKKFRWNIAYYQRRLKREGELEFRRTSDPEKVPEDIETFFGLHQKRFVSQRKLGRFLSPRFVSFHIDVASEMLKSDRLGLFFLSIDDLAVASLYGFELGGTYYYYLAGFEPSWGKFSVSTVLLSLVFEECINKGLARFDFMRGAEPYKLRWGAVGTQNARLIIERPTPRAGFVRRLIQTENELVVRAKARAAEV